MLVAHYKRKAPSGAYWSELYGEGARVHVAAGLHTTLCGLTHDAPTNGNVSSRGWEMYQGRTSEASCAHCIRIATNRGIR